MLPKVLHSPFFFAFLVGFHPSLFFISNNWFVFRPIVSLCIVLLPSFLTYSCLSILRVALSKISTIQNKHILKQLPDRLFTFLGFIAWFYLLREPMLGILDNHHGNFLGLTLFLSGVFGWNILKWQYVRINTFLVTVCIVSLISGMFSIFQAKPWKDIYPITSPSNQTLFNQIKFKKRPNVYYIIPDGYPSREALEKIYKIDNGDFYRKLEELGFSTTHSAYSNYISTIASVTSLLGMGHHYYTFNIGVAEVLGGRKFIVGKQNPTASLFVRNGYKIHHLHQNDYLFKKGCFVDSCSPNAGWEEAIELVIPWRLKTKLGLVTDTSLVGFNNRMFTHIKNVSLQTQPHFTFVHIKHPSHSLVRAQKIGELTSFREGFSGVIQESNALLEKLVRTIIAIDPNALIILNSDHGAFGLGWYGLAKNDVFEGLSEDLTVLDHMGVLLTIRWPTPPPFSESHIKTNVNLFRAVFAYLSENEDVLKTDMPNNSYLRMRDKVVFEVVRDGKRLHPPEKFTPGP